MHAQATKVWLSFDNHQVSEERYLWQNQRSLSHGPRGSSDRQRRAMPKPRHEKSPSLKEPEDVSIRGEALHPDNLSGSQSAMFGRGWVTWLFFDLKNWGENMNRGLSTDISPFRHTSALLANNFTSISDVFLSATGYAKRKWSALDFMHSELIRSSTKKDVHKIIQYVNVNGHSESKMHTWTIACMQKSSWYSHMLNENLNANLSS